MSSFPKEPCSITSFRFKFFCSIIWFGAYLFLFFVLSTSRTLSSKLARKLMIIYMLSELFLIFRCGLLLTNILKDHSPILNSHNFGNFCNYFHRLLLFAFIYFAFKEVSTAVTNIEEKIKLIALNKKILYFYLMLFISFLFVSVG